MSLVDRIGDRRWCGSSAVRAAERLRPDAVVVMLGVDTGFKYLSVAPYDLARAD